MSNTQLYIPDRINVGFQKRDDTYTKMLGYVIYFDKKGVLRKETSWQNWRDKKIANKEFANEPTEGFVLNRDVGGARRSYGWDTRIEKVRVYDPRDFEFEIDIPNLLFILKECDCSRGKGLEGKFVYAWRGNSLILLPASCEDYKASKNYTELQGKSIKAKELVPGASYVTKKQDVLTYLGKFDYHYLSGGRYGEVGKGMSQKRLIFWNDAIAEYSKKKIGFVYMDAPKNIAALNSDAIRDEFAELVQKYHKSEHGSKVVKLYLKEDKKEKDANDRHSQWYYEKPEGVFVQATTSNDWNTKKHDYTQTSCQWSMLNGVLTQNAYRTISYAPGTTRRSYTHGYYGNDREVQVDWVEPTNMALWAELESGAKFKIDYSTFRKD